MPLRNARYERFAQGLADGKSQERAYKDAGFSQKSARANAATLLKRVKGILERRDELLAERDEDARRVRGGLIERTLIDKAWLLERLVQVVDRCMQYEPVLDRQGKQVMVKATGGQIAPAYAFDARGANAALRTIAAVTGNLVVRHQHSKSPLDRLSPELVRRLERALTVQLEPAVPALP